jgi:hypothetical protein
MRWRAEPVFQPYPHHMVSLSRSTAAGEAPFSLIR